MDARTLLDGRVAAGTFPRTMRVSSSTAVLPDGPDDNLDLPAIDGGEGSDGDEPLGGSDDELELDDHDEGDALDDATAGDDVAEGVAFLSALSNGAETGLLDGAEDAAHLDVGVFDLVIGAEGPELLDDAADADDDGDHGLVLDEEAVEADGGEEGPLADDEELREEDLPALDADDEGDVPDEHLFEGGLLADHDELRWDDRAWSRVDGAVGFDDDGDDSGLLSVPGEDVANRARDAVWKRFDETGRVTAAAVLPGGEVVLALATPDWGRALLVRVAGDGAARIVAEIEPGAPSDDDAPCKVTALRWQRSEPLLVATGTFGTCAFRPA
jgi:hypothetical protein